ncbi:MAG: transglutaminase domain-containing protein [Bdellovibrionales bacterium]|nr:transglutaminase domain-containing protein [Bdellovibrionales bacterium]
MDLIVSEEFSPEEKNWIVETNSLKTSTSEIEYGLSRSEDGIISSFSVDHFRKTSENSRFIMDYSISPSDGYAEGIFIVTIETHNTIENKNAQEISQSFVVKESCELKLTQTDFSTLKKTSTSTSTSTFSLDKHSYFAGGETSFETKQLDMPSESDMVYVNSSAEAFNLHSGFSTYVSGIGILSGDVTEEPSSSASEFGEDIDFKNLLLVLSQENFPLLHLHISESSDSRYSRMVYEEVPNFESWVLPRETWDSLTLNTTPIDSSYFTSELGANYFDTHDSFQLLASETPSYDHLDAYWLKSKESSGNKEFPYSVILTENKTAQVAGESTAEDLEINETIQGDLPEIKKIAADINEKNSTNRIDQIRLILQYLSDHYTYDHEMLKNNVVRPLTTKEALDRKTGVCQHYAVIFTSIARALGIPTRIVSGFFLGGERPGAHAWVEAEVEKGLWQVIEPQDKNGLTATQTRYYFPVARARFLEDKKVDIVKAYIERLKRPYKLLPIEGRLPK